MPHKYHLRQQVRLTRSAYLVHSATATGVFEITRLMPADETGEFSYRIRSPEGGERAVRESEITARLT